MTVNEQYQLNSRAKGSVLLICFLESILMSLEGLATMFYDCKPRKEDVFMHLNPTLQRTQWKIETIVAKLQNSERAERWEFCIVLKLIFGFFLSVKKV